jgi:predicted RND superfamily exporter protein
MSGPASLLRRALLWPVDHPRAAVGAMLLIAIVASWSASRIRPDASLAAMFPRHDPAADALVRVLDDFPAADQLIVLASLPDNSAGLDPDQLLAFGERFENALHQSPDVEHLTTGIYFRADAQSRQFVEKVIGPSALFYLDDESFQAARRRLGTDDIRRQIAQDKSLLSAPGPAAQAFSNVMRQDPLRLHEFITSRLRSRQPFRTYQNADAFISPDGRTLLIRIPGRRPPSDLDFSRKLVGGIDAVARRANTNELKLEYAGSYAIAAESARTIRRDMIESVIGSVVLLQALFLAAYRSPFKLFLLAFGPVALGILYGFGAYAWISPRLTPLTAVLGAILAGMGIDYSIQYLSYYESRRVEGSEPRAAAEQSALRMSAAVFAAWFTSIIGFLAIGWSNVKALTDFAILGTLGLLGAFVCSLVLLPALLMLSDRRPTPIARGRIRLSAAPLVEALGKWRRSFIAIAAILFACSLAILLRGGDLLPLESDLTVMHPRPNAAIEAQNHVSERFGVSPGQLAVYLHIRDDQPPEQLVSLAYQVNERLTDAACASAGVSGTYGLAALLPDPRRVESRRAAFTAADADRIVSDFRAALAENDFATEPFDDYAKFLHLLLTQRAAPGIEQLIGYRTLAETVLPASALGGAPPREAISFVFVSRSLDIRENRAAAVTAVRDALRGLDGATVTGLGVVGHDAEQTVRHELPRLILAAVLILAVYHTIHFRNLPDAALSLVPMLFGIVTLAAVMRISGQHLNMVNLVAVPLLIGIDVDYGIFLVNLARVRVVRIQTPAELSRYIEPATHAVILCATATFLGFGSLIWTSVPAERSLGIATGIGIITCLIAVLFLLVPIFFSLARRR